MSDFATNEKKDKSSISKSQLYGYERPNFFHKSKSTKKSNTQFSTSNPSSKVLGDIKVNIEPFSSKISPDYIDLLPNSEYDSDVVERNEKDETPLTSYNENTPNDFNNESDVTDLNNQHNKVFSPQQKVQSPNDKKTQSKIQPKAILLDQPQMTSEVKKKKISNQQNNTPSEEQKQNKNNKSPLKRYTPQTTKAQKQRLNPYPYSSLSANPKSAKSAKQDKTSNLTPQSKQRNKSPRKSTSSLNRSTSPSSKKSPRKDVFLPGETITTRALKNLGFTPEDLEYPSEARINEFTKNNALKPYVREELCKDVDERIALFNQEKERLKAIKKDEDGEIKEDDSFEKEQIKQKKEFDEIMQKSLERQRREIVFKIFVILAEKYRKLEEQRKQQMTEKRHQEYLNMIQEKHKIEEENNLKRQAFFQQKEIDRENRNQEYKQMEAEKEEMLIQKKEEEKKEREKKIHEFDKMKQERLDQHYEIEKQKDLARHAQLQTRLKELEERRQRVKIKQQQQQQELRAKNERKHETHEQLMAGIMDEKQKKLQKLKEKLAERDFILQEKLKELDREKQQIIEERRTKTENCIQRAKLIREEKQKVQINQVYKIREQRAEEYSKQLEAKRIERLARSAEIDKEIKERLKQLQDEKDERIIKRHDEYMQKDSLRTKQIEEKRQQDAAEREMESLRNKIDMSRRQFSLLVHERQKAGLNQDRDYEMRLKMQKIKDIEIKKRDQQQFLIQRSQIADSNRRYAVQHAQEELILAKTEDQLRLIAESYGIDFDAIDALARDPRSSKKTVFELIHNELDFSKNDQ